MRSNITIIVLLATIFSINIGFKYKENATMQHAQGSIYSKDLAEYGLILIPPSDPSFDDLIATFQEPNSSTEVLKPFSVLLKNTGSKAVVAYQLKWELRGIDGRTSVRTNGSINLRKLKTTSSAKFQELTSETGNESSENVIKPGSVLRCLPIGTLGTDPATVGGLTGIVATSTVKEANEQGQKQSTPSATLSKVADQLSQFTDITVSLDGALFDDGTFVGPDTTNFYSWIVGQSNARMDLLQELQSLRGKSDDEAVKHLKTVSDRARISVNHKSTSDDIYNFYKRRFAIQMLKMHAARGFEPIERELLVLTEHKVKLRKE